MLGPNKPPRTAYMILPECPEEPEFCESAVFPGHISSVIERYIVDEHRASRSIALTLETRRELFSVPCLTLRTPPHTPDALSLRFDSTVGLCIGFAHGCIGV